MAGDLVYNPAKYRSLGTLGQGGVASPLTSNGQGTTGAVAATLTAATNMLAYITGLVVSRSAGAGAVVTVSGLKVGTITFFQVSTTPTVITFDPPLPASALAGSITVTSAADATGANVNVSAWGFQA